MNKKNFGKYAIAALCAVSVAFSTGAFIKANAAEAPAVAAGQPVD